MTQSPRDDRQPPPPPPRTPPPPPPSSPPPSWTPPPPPTGSEPDKIWIPPPPPGPAYAGAPQPKRSRTGLWVLIGGGLVTLALVAAVGIGAYLLLGHNDEAKRVDGADAEETEQTNSDLEAVTSEPTRTWAWKSKDEVRWTVAGPDFTLALLAGKAGFVALDETGKELWRGEPHDYSGAWVNDDTKTIQASWYGPITATAGGDTTSDSGTIVYDYDGKVLWKDTNDDHFVQSVEKDDTFLIHDSEAKTLRKMQRPDDKGAWTIPAENVTLTDDWIYTIHGDTLARYSRDDGTQDWKVDLPAGWKGPKQWYDVNLGVTDDLVVVVGYATYGLSTDKGASLWKQPGDGAVVRTAGDRLAVIEEGQYDVAQKMTMPSHGPYPIYDTTGKVGSLPFSTADPYGAVQMLKVDGDGAQVNFGPDDGALYDAAGKAQENGYEHAYQALDDGCYLVDGATVSFRTWHEKTAAWTLPLEGVESIENTVNHRDVYVGVGDGRLVINDKHNVWLYE